MTGFGPTQPFALLAGAGVSCDKPSLLPLATEFVPALLRTVGFNDAEVEKLQALRFEMLLGLVQEHLDPNLRVMDLFGSNTPNENHRLIARLLQQGAVALTTNFDCLIERASEHLKIPLSLVFRDGDFESPDVREPVLYKLHGSLLDSRGLPAIESIRATLRTVGRDGARMAEGSDKQRALNRILGERDLVVVGYSGADDFDICPALLRAPGRRNVWWLEHDGSERLGEAPIPGLECPAGAFLHGWLDEGGANTVHYLVGPTSEFLAQLAGTPTPAIPPRPPLDLAARLAAWFASVPVRESWVENFRGSVWMTLPDFVRARAAVEKAIACAGSPQDRVGPETNLGAILAQMRDFDGARSALECAVRDASDALGRRQSDASAPSLVAHACLELGILELRCRNDDRSEAWLRRVISESASIAEPWQGDFEARARGMLGRLFAHRAEVEGDDERQRALYAEAHEHCRTSLALARNRGLLAEEAKVLNEIAFILRQTRAPPDDVRATFAESIKLKRLLGNQRDLANSLNNLAVLCQDAGQYGEALTHYREAAALREDLGLYWEAGNARYRAAEALLEGELPAAAASSVSRALELFAVADAPDYGQANDMEMARALAARLAPWMPGASDYSLFSKEAKQALIHAQEFARTLGQTSIGLDHLVVGVLSQPNGRGAILLNERGVYLEDTKTTLDGATRPESGEWRGLRPETRDALDDAREAARQSKGSSPCVLTEHILFGILEQPWSRTLLAINPPTSALLRQSF